MSVRTDDDAPKPLAPRVTEGFRDPGSSLPRNAEAGNPDTNQAARGVRRDVIDVTTHRGARGSSVTPQTDAADIGDPNTPAYSQYPYNQVMETPRGHRVEYDDTPGFERINIEHRTGTRITLNPDGSMTARVRGRKYEVVASDSDLIVRGTVNIIVESNADIRVQGDTTLQVDGDMNQLVQGNYNLEVLGDSYRRVHGDDTQIITGTGLRTTRGAQIERNLSTYLERTVDTHTSEYGGTWKLTTQADIDMISYGPFNGSYYGGFVTLNGKNENGEDGVGLLEADEYYGRDYNAVNIYATTSISSEGKLYAYTDIHIGGDGYCDGTLHVPYVEGLAEKATYADGAGTAAIAVAIGGSAPSATTPVPTAAQLESTHETPSDSNQTAADVTGTSTDYILAVDRSALTNNHNTRPLNTGEATARARNRALRYNGEWLQDLIDTGAVLESIAESSPPTPRRTTSDGGTNYGSTVIGQQVPRAYPVSPGSALRVTSIPAGYEIINPSRRARLSRNFRVAHMLGADSLSARLQTQLGLSIEQILQNMQAVSYNILEPLRNKYRDTWTISEGLYNPLPNEEIDGDSLTFALAQGLGVGIQSDNLFNIASWIQNNLVYDKLVLSYIDYDPSEANVPTLIVTIDIGSNARTVQTEFNHELVASELQDLSS